MMKMTRATLHEVAVLSRNALQNVWFNDRELLGRKALYAKCRGLVCGDRAEIAAFNQDWSYIHKVDADE
ncbi:MAG: hypothetical protein [Caudoviricetes sp.]|nr:MAG: hypothetical protein [Caudoviricetes sp.]